MDIFVDNTVVATITLPAWALRPPTNVVENVIQSQVVFHFDQMRMAYANYEHFLALGNQAFNPPAPIEIAPPLIVMSPPPPPTPKTPPKRHNTRTAAGTFKPKVRGETARMVASKTSPKQRRRSLASTRKMQKDFEHRIREAAAELVAKDVEESTE